jgi:hypothetical protein
LFFFVYDLVLTFCSFSSPFLFYRENTFILSLWERAGVRVKISHFHLWGWHCTDAMSVYHENASIGWFPSSSVETRGGKLLLATTFWTLEKHMKQELHGHRFPSWSLGTSGANRSILKKKMSEM